MVIKYIQDEVFQDYKKVSMLIAFPTCTFKCDIECGQPICQNGDLATRADIEIPIGSIVARYLENPISKAIVLGGLEPMDDFENVMRIASTFRTIAKITDDIVIYTGYTEDEVEEKVKKLKAMSNIIIKFGRFIPDRPKKYDEVLGVWLASDNQYARKIS